MADISDKRLFQPLKVGHVELQHRIALAPLTRFRATREHVPGQYAEEYYVQRAAEKGTLLITEATFISPRAGGYKHVPGIWNADQVAGWRKVTDAVHAKGSSIFLQLWALGRVAVPKVLEEEGGYLVSGPSALPADPTKGQPPHVLTEEEIQAFIQDYANAGKNAIAAGFDGVEIHGANGYLIDQFTQDVSNQRTDKWGGSVENRARFGLEVTKAVIAAIGDSQRVAIRLSPYNDFQGMRMKDPVPQFKYIVTELKKLNLAYLHLTESKIAGKTAHEAVYDDLNRENDPFIEIWGKEAPLVLAGGLTVKKVNRIISELYTSDNLVFAYGRHFISTPDLVFRARHGVEFNPYDRTTFYTPEAREGYIDYPFSQEYLAKL